MSSDCSRDGFDALRDHAGVFLQQGRAVLDSDWNEMVKMFERRIRATTVDTIGRGVVPRETLQGFQIQFATAGGIEIGRGRKYLSGLLLECHGAANFSGERPDLPDPALDLGRDNSTNPAITGPEGVLDELISPPDGDFVNYLDQPYWPTPEALPDAGTGLVYVVAWQREVTPVINPVLLEPALGGLDTTTRWQTVWQVRNFDAPEGTTCETPDQDIPGWLGQIAPSTARLTNGTVDIENPEDPCLVPPTEGYTGLENQFYRVEIHTADPFDADGNPTDQTDAFFKFSRENASVLAAVESISAGNDSVVLSRIGRDEILRFRAGDWVELTDNNREFDHRSGLMLRVASVNEETREIEFEAAIDDDPANADLVPDGVGGDTVSARRTRLIRWDQQGMIRQSDGTDWFNLNDASSTGVIPVPPAGVVLVLESGITVQFDTATGQGRYHEMDHWQFSARTAGTQIDPLRDAPPAGVLRHYCRLAVVDFARSQDGDLAIDDCRVFWPPEFEGGRDGCYCTVCVTPEGHNSGVLTIQQAIDQLPDAGGTVCIEAGLYLLDTPVLISDRNAVTVSGQGLGTILLYRGSGGAIQLETTNDVQLERFTVFVIPGEDAAGNSDIAHGVTAINTGLTALRRLAVLVFSANPEDRVDHGMALDGTQLGTKVEECLVVAPVALGSRSTFGLDEDGDLTFVAFAELRVLDNILFGARAAIQFGRVAINLSAALLGRNLILSGNTGIGVNWAEIPAGNLAIDTSTIVAERDGIVLGADTVHVRDCEITGGEGGDGIRLVPNLIPEARTDAQLIGNTIFDLTGAGIRIAGLHDNLLIKHNLIRRCDEAGIATAPEAEIAHIAIDNNVIEDVPGVGAQIGAVGVLLTSAATGQIIGNRIDAIGENALPGQTYAGIGVQGTGSVDISHNTISNIGAGTELQARARGIIAAPPFLGLTITDNRIVQIGGFITDANLDWQALQIGVTAPPARGGNVGSITPGNLAAVPTVASEALAYVAVGESVYRLASESFAIALPNLSSQISVKGNQMRTDRRLQDALVMLFDSGSRSLDFSGNQCILDGGGGLQDSVVSIGAQRLTASSNAVTHTADALSVRLVTGAQGAATPIGNITTNRITLNGSGLPAPFIALNLQA